MTTRASVLELRLLVQAYASGGVRTEQELRDRIKTYAEMIKADVTEDQIANLFDEMRHKHGVRMEIGSALVAPDFKKWLDSDRMKSINWFYWDRYRQYLSDSGFPGPVLAAMHQKTDMVINRPLKKSAVQNGFLPAQLSGFGFGRLGAESMPV